MKATILCITTGNPLTMMAPEARPESPQRIYRMAEPGQILTWGPRDCDPQISMSMNQTQPAYRSAAGHEYAYGLCVLEDFIWLEDDLLQNRHTEKERVMSGRERAQDIIRVMIKYGGVILQDDEPTASEIARAIRQRTTFATQRINHAIQMYQKAMAGKQGHAEYNDADMAWANEMNAKLPNSFDALQRIEESLAQPTRINRTIAYSGEHIEHDSTETSPCPFCFQMIDPRAMKCRHCGEKDKEPLSKLLAVSDAPIAATNLMAPDGDEPQPAA